MNANDTDIRPEEMKREPQAFEQLTREELEQTAGGALIGSYWVLFPYLRAQPEPPGIWFSF